MIALRLTLVLLLFFVALGACRIGEDLPDIGESCDDSDECEGKLGCMPTNAENPAGPRVCMPPPDGFEDRCDAFFLGDKDAVCDCGCGVHDPDCPDDTAAVCNADLGLHCPEGQSVVADDNTRCE